MNKIFEQNYTTTVADMDMHYRLTPFGILNYCQDVATLHAKLLGVSREDLMRKNGYWIVSKITFKSLKNIGLGEKIKLKTWVSDIKLIYTDRDYIIFNQAGEEAVHCTSRWCVVDSSLRELKTMRDVYSPEIVTKEKHIELEKIIISTNDYDSERMQRVGMSDIDVNLHLNNAKYANLIFNMLEYEELDNYNIESFSISYLKELLVGQTVNVGKCKSGNELYFTGRKEENGETEEVFRAKLSLKK